MYFMRRMLLWSEKFSIQKEFRMDNEYIVKLRIINLCEIRKLTILFLITWNELTGLIWWGKIRSSLFEKKWKIIY